MATRFRTAVLCVHGIGSQRPLETVRGIVNAVWFDSDDHPTGSERSRAAQLNAGTTAEASSGHQKRIWTHPESGGDDIDLQVMTTNEVRETSDQRSVDFHELYWAHLMSETRAVAVLLWLMELVRKGPHLNPGMAALWWSGAVFMCLLFASVTLLVLRGIELFAQLGGEPQIVLLAPLIVLCGVAGYSALFAGLVRAFKLAVPLAVIAAVLALVTYLGINCISLAQFTNAFSAPVASVLVAGVVMGTRGLRVAFLLYLFSLTIWIGYWFCLDGFTFQLSDKWGPGFLPWGLTENWSIVIACMTIVLYLALNALFLQSYLGDAARYFRNSPGNVMVRRQTRKLAVDTLTALHESGLYDRIVVVAHSQGTVVAYDMLRAYFSQISNDLPEPALLGPAVAAVDSAAVDPFKTIPDAQKSELRRNARAIVAKIAEIAGTAMMQARAKESLSMPSAPASPKSWLVTDFVTLGSPLTHAHYLMCQGNTYEKLKLDFERRVDEREFPTAPPRRLDQDGLLTFFNPRSKRREFHHGALFGLTRWTNLYFPRHQLFWGDAVGGAVASVFGGLIDDNKVSTSAPPRDSLFTHNTYWDTKRTGGRAAPHIVALRAAIDLADRDKPA